MTYTPGAVAEAIGPKGRKIDERASALFSKSASLKVFIIHHCLCQVMCMNSMHTALNIPLL